MEGEESGEVNCPVCYKSVLSRDAEVHVDACLREASLRATQHGSPLAQTGSSPRGSSAAAGKSTLKQSLIGGAPARKRGSGQRTMLTGVSSAKIRKESSAQKELSQSSVSNVNAPVVRRTTASDQTESGQSTVAGGAESVPLADVVRPSTLEEYVGQEAVVGADRLLRPLLECGEVPSVIFWGPPGCGKVSNDSGSTGGSNFSCAPIF